MEVNAIKTAIVHPGDSLFAFLQAALPPLTEGSIVALTSKMISTCENRIIAKSTIAAHALVQQEADAYLPPASSGKQLTIKQQRIVPSAGIDESNVRDAYILYPENSQESAEKIWHFLRDTYQLTQLGVIITDSTITPLRSGTTGVCIGWCGFAPLYDYVGSKDIFQQTLRMSKINLLDALATAAVFVMGEGAEQTPLAIIRHAPKVTFQTSVPSAAEKKSISIDVDQDLFAPLLQQAAWVWKK